MQERREPIPPRRNVGQQPERRLPGRLVVCSDRAVAQLLNQVLLLLGYFCVMHPSNQAMLTWGRSPSILQRLCSLPDEYSRVPALRTVLMPTMLCVCFGAERTAELVAHGLCGAATAIDPLPFLPERFAPVEAAFHG